MRRWLALAVLVGVAACGGPTAKPTSPAVVPVDKAAVIGVATPAAAPSSNGSVVVRAARAASRRPSRSRVVRRLLAERRGRLELPNGYAELGLIVERVVSGTLDDPEFAKRPIGINVLDVVVIDEAAYAMPDGLDGFEGEWRLTRTADGDLIASSIKDTPFAASKAGERTRAIGLARASLRADAADARLEGIHALGAHAFYELVPDLIALLDDRRGGTPIDDGHMKSIPIVQDEASRRLRQMIVALGAEPPLGDRATWETFWRELVGNGPRPRPPILASMRSEIVAAGERSFVSRQEAAATSDGTFLWPLGDVAPPIDGRGRGLLRFGADGTRSWASPEPNSALAAASMNGGTAFVHAAHQGAWSFVLAAPGRAPRTLPTSIPPEASHVGFGAGKTGFASIHSTGDPRALFVIDYDGNGRQLHPERRLPLPSGANAVTGYHRGVHPLAIAGMNDGWLALVETSSGLRSLALNKGLGLESSGDLPPTTRLLDPKLAVRGDRALAVWRQNDSSGATLGYAMLDASGTVIPGGHGATSDEVDDLSTPIALDDGGFAVAWIESRTELHVGRWSASGTFASDHLLQARTHSEGPVLLTRDGADLVVAFDDKSRYPFSVALRRFPMNALR